MKIVIDKDIPFIKGRLPEGCETLYLPGEKICTDDVSDADALIVRTRTKCNETLLKDSGVKFVATATIGTDHIDIPWCESHGISVENAPGCNAPGVAQYVLASLLKTGFDPAKHTLGIVGHGNVGTILAHWAEQIGIRTLVSDAPKKAKGIKTCEYMELEEVLRNSDAVSLHVPYTTSGLFPTRYLIDTRELALMKPGAVLVNSSRGGVVNEKALKEAIFYKGLKGVVDVWENEPYIDPELVRLTQIATPHIAGYSQEGKKRATRMVLESLGKTFNLPVDLSGLECPGPYQSLKTRQLIERSYDPMEDSRALKQDITRFESLRNNYSYRHEP